MNIRNNQIFRTAISGMIICLLFVLTAVMTILGCSRRSTDPVVNINYPDSQYDLPLSSVIYFDGLSGSSIMAVYDLEISGDGSFADLVSVRDASIGESYIISGETIFTNFCRDCLQIRGIGLDINQDIKLEFFIKHPMKKGDPSLPPSANNRLDLDVFDVALNVQPLNTTPQTFDLTGVNIYSETMTNPHGYSQELKNLIGDDAAIPFRMCYISDPEENNRFEMGSSSEFNVVLKSPGGSYRLYLTMNYGISADFHSRLDPQYYVPEFNKKAAWRIKVYCPKYLAEDTVHPNVIQIHVFDWQMNYYADPDFPDPLHNGYLSSPSQIESVTVEIPGMIDYIAQAVKDQYPHSVSVYKTSIANENGLPVGIYTGLVKVTDNRVAGTIPGFNSDSLMHTDDGGQSFTEYNIDEFATFQTFEVQVYDFSLNPSLAGMYYPMAGFDDIDFQGDYAYIENPYEAFEIVDLSDPVRPKIVGSITEYEGIEWISGISVEGDIACVLGDHYTSGRFLHVVDISDKAHPAIIGKLEFNDNSPYAVEMMGNTVYVLHGSSKLQELTIVDITQPSAPGIISTWNMNYDCRNFIKIRGNYLYFGGLKILDISDPHDVQIAASLDLGCYENAAIHGNYFYYACEEEGLKIIDISDPTNPFVASVLDSITAYDVVIGFNHAYVVSSSKRELYQRDELLVIDISNPLSPNQVNSLSGFGYIRNIAINGEYVYFREWDLLYTLSIAQPDNPVIGSGFNYFRWPCSVAANDKIALVCHSDGMLMFDIADETNPTLLRSERPFTPQAVELSGDIGYLLFGSRNFVIADFTDPANPVELCSLRLWGVRDLIVKDNLVYIAGDSGLIILDVSDPANPITLFDGNNHCGSVAIDIENDRLYGVTYTMPPPPVIYLVITDISDPTNPVEEGSTYLGLTPEDIAVNGNYAYVAGGDKCRIFDVSDPMNPVSVSDIPVTHTKCVKIRDDLLYMGDVGQLEIYDLVDPENPAMINSFEAIGFYSAFDLRENYAYCGDEIGGFAIVELW